jgi:hypothetical protein
VDATSISGHHSQVMHASLHTQLLNELSNRLGAAQFCCGLQLFLMVGLKAQRLALTNFPSGAIKTRGHTDLL